MRDETVRKIPTKLPPSGLFWGNVAISTGTGSGLFFAHSIDSHPLNLAKNSSPHNDNSKSDIVVAVARIVIVTIGRATIRRIIVPRTATQHLAVPVPSSPSLP